MAVAVAEVEDDDGSIDVCDDGVVLVDGRSLSSISFVVADVSLSFLSCAEEEVDPSR